MSLTALLPPGIDAASALFLVLLSVFTSALTAALGIGGGMVLLAAMTFFVPVAALIPVHGAVQLGSNAGRSLVLARDVDLRLIGPFTVGAAMGALIGAVLVTDLPETVLLLFIGVFVSVSTWIKLPPLGRGERAVLFTGGLGATILTMFVGATGPFVMALLRQAQLPHRVLVATNGAAMTVQHLLKVGAFALLGFAFARWLPLVTAMIGSGFLGTLMGKRLLDRLPEKTLGWGLKFLLTVVGVQLIVRAIIALLP
ncbi:MAG: sulfite exporter TauE/SafE family protein [Pseudomonadota bacterium]